ncbi:hypothetical protein M9Y10_027353 [Tritrichomonas musculus]|uniref:Uncharacterized protein n=1 Tax=Tritrichomonas musculus TaxID=1915356 RepID=A0ABR2H4I8_9EUKA
MNRLNLQPFTKILKSEYSLNSEDLAQYSVPLYYLDARLKEFKELLPSNSSLDEETKNLHSRLISVKGRINKANTEYSKLNTAIIRLQRNLDDMDSLVKETEHAWESLHKVEEQLPTDSTKYT